MGVVKLQLMSSAWPGVEKAVLPAFPASTGPPPLQRLHCGFDCENTANKMGSDDAGMKCRREFYEQPP